MTLIERTPAGSGDGASAPPADVTLVGTVAGPSGTSYAIFFDKQSNKQKVLRIGEDVFNIGILKAVSPISVDIDAQGRILTFYLPFNKPPVGAGVQTQAPQPSGGKGISRSGGDNSWVIDQRALNAVLNDMEKVLTDARLLPYMEGGKIVGFRMSEVKPNGIFGMIGLKNGDVLLKVNDFPIDSPEKGVQLLNGLRGESQITLDIIRGNRPQRLSYQIR